MKGEGSAEAPLFRRRILEDAVDACPADLELPGNLSCAHAALEQRQHFISLRARRRSAALVFAFRLRLGDAFALALQHDLALELGDGADHVEDQAADRRRRVELRRQHLEACALRMKPGLDLAEVRNRAGDAVNLGDHQHIAFAGEVERRLKLRPFRVDARKLLANIFLTPAAFRSRS